MQMDATIITPRALDKRVNKIVSKALFHMLGNKNLLRACRLFTPAICLLLLSFESHAQTKGVEPNSHEPRIYIDDNEMIYVREDQDIYLWMGTSDKPQAEKHRMKSRTHPDLTDPMPLDGHGEHSIKHKDHHENVEVQLQLYADGRAPRTELKLRDASTHRSADTWFFGKGLYGEIETTDRMAGVQHTYFALDDGGFRKYDDRIDMNNEKAFSIKYYAVDNVGNVSEVKDASFTVDHTSPVTNHTIEGIHDKNTLAPSARIRLTSKDALSGVNNTRYSINEGSEHIYRSPATLNHLADGEHTITFYAMDNVDNTESVNTYTFYLDKIPPEVQIAVEGDQHDGSRLFVSPRTQFKITATDNKAGVDEVNYEFSRAPGKKTYSKTFRLPEIRGLQRIDYYATDNVANRSTTQKLLVYYDDVNPSTNIRYGSPQFFGKDTLYINHETRVILTGKDVHSGVMKTEYARNDESMQHYTEPFTIDREGFYTIQFRSIDHVNNTETEKESKVFVDMTPPKLNHYFSIEPMGKEQKEGETVHVYPNYVRLYLGATDKNCGTDKITYSINGGAFTEYSTPKTLDISELDKFAEEKFYTVTVRAADKLGNTNEETIRFLVSDK